MMIHFKIAFGAAAVLALVSVLAVGRSSAPPPVAAEVEPEPMPSMDDTYREIALSALRASGQDARIVPIERIIPPQVPHVTVATPRAVETSVADQKKAESNICTRNNRRKVWVSKHKWRCLK
jgi:hypothetical protein